MSHATLHIKYLECAAAKMFQIYTQWNKLYDAIHALSRERLSKPSRVFYDDYGRRDTLKYHNHHHNNNIQFTLA